MTEPGYKRQWPDWWWRYPFSTGIFSPRVPDDYDPFANLDAGFVASMVPTGGEPPPGWVKKIPPPPEPHSCKLPKDTNPRRVGRFDFDQPPRDAGIGSLWKCPCGQVWEIYNSPHAIGSGSVWYEHAWRRHGGD